MNWQKMKQRVEILEELVMPTLKDFFIELEKVDPELCAALKTYLRQSIDSPNRGGDIKRSKERRASFLIRATAVMRKQGDPETALPTPKFRAWLVAVACQISGISGAVGEQ